VSASLLFLGCSTSGQRPINHEKEHQTIQVLDLRMRMSNAENRLTSAENRLSKVEDAASGRRDAHAAAKAGTGQKETAHSDRRKAEPKGTPAAVIPVAAASLAPPQSSSPAPFVYSFRMEESSHAAKAAPLASARPAAQAKTDSDEYDAALTLYNTGQYDKALEQFSGFLSRHPSSNLAPNAMYWQAECLYAQKDFSSAIIIFKNLVGRYPKHPKAAAALLKAGFAYAQIRDMENARFYWQILVDDFPKSEPAAIARQRLALR